MHLTHPPPTRINLQLLRITRQSSTDTIGTTLRDAFVPLLGETLAEDAIVWHDGERLCNGTCLYALPASSVLHVTASSPGLLFVNIKDGMRLTIRYTPEDTVGEVMTRLEEKYGLPEEAQVLKMPSGVLIEDRTCAIGEPSANVQEG